MNTKKLTCLIFISTLAIILIAPMQSSAQAVDEPWPMFHQDQFHTGAGTGTAPTNLAVKWKTSINGAVVSSPVVAYGKVYIGSMDKNLYCLDAQTGSVTWKFQTGWRIRSTVAVNDGKVYTGADDGTVYCLNADTGTLVWQTKLSDLIIGLNEAYPFQIRSSPTVVSGKVYVGHMDSYVYCLNADDGSQVWKYKTGGTLNVVSSPAVAADKVYIGAGDQYLHCINATTGTLVWKYDAGRNLYNTRREVTGSPTVVESLNMVVFYANAYSVYHALNMNTGDVIWKYWCLRMRPYTWSQTTQATTFNTPAYSKETNSFYGLDDHFAQRLDAATGRAMWPIYGSSVDQTPGGSLDVPTGQIVDPLSGAGQGDSTQSNDIGFINIASPAYVDGKVYFGSNRQSFFVFDATSATGERLSWYATNGWVVSSPAIAYGNAYVGSIDMNLYCFTEGPARRMDPNDPTGTVPLLDPTMITGTLSATEVKVDDWIYMEGAVEYQPNAIIYERALVFATFIRPDGSTWNDNMMAEWDGTYKISYQPDMEGTWTVKPRWLGDTYNAGTEGTPITFTVVSQTPPTPTPPPAQTGIIPGLSDIYIYAGIAIVAVIAILTIAAVWHTRKRKQ